MRIMVDARQVFRAARRGTGKNLVDLYTTLAARQPDWEFLLACREEGPDHPLADLPNVRRVRLDIPGADRFNLWEEVRLPIAARLAGANALHAPANTGPRLAFVPMVLTVHDLIPLEMDPDSPRARRWVKAVRRAAHAAAHIITPSQYTKGRIIQHLDVSADKITVNGWAPDRCTRKTDDQRRIARVRQKYGVGPREPYIFGFGASDPRKNTRRVIEAYAALPADLRRSVRLLLVGIQEPALSEFRTLADARGLCDRALLHGFADEGDLTALLSGAELLCFPSRSEGFGLPILDAFACETAVLTSDRTSLPEVAGDAAVLVDPDEVESIRDGLARLLMDMKVRETLIRRGRERLRAFSWERCAAVLAEVFKSVQVSGRGSARRNLLPACL
jgi:glycosyltransferase involved in cell wall biosynthesis